MTTFRRVGRVFWRIEFKRADCWIGAYVRRDDIGYGQEEMHVWLCLIPMVPLHLTWLASRGR